MFSIPAYINLKLFISFIVLVALNFVFGITIISLKKEKNIYIRIFSNILALMLIGFFMYMAYANKICQDYDTYVAVYEYSSFKDKGFSFLMSLFKNAGYDYHIFRVGVYALSYILLYISVTAFKANKNFVFSLFALFPWCYNAYQTRTWLGFVLVMFACVFLTLKGKWKIIGVPLFTLFIYFAYTMHGANILYGIFIVIFASYKEKNFLVLIGFIVSLVGFAFYFNGYDVVMKFMPEKIYNKYFLAIMYTSHVPNYREYIALFKNMVFQLLAAGFALLGFSGIRFKLKPRKIYDRKTINEAKSDYNIVLVFFYLTICMFCLMLAVTVSTDLLRLQRNFIIFIYIMIAISMRNSKLKVFDPFILLSLGCALYSNYLLVCFSETWEAGGFEMAFWVFFNLH